MFRSACNGDRYDYVVVDIDHGWSTTIDVMIDGAVIPGVTFSHADNKAYWDWYYAGYNAPTACDYTQNCHGYAFGVGDWPDTAREITGIGSTTPESPTEWPVDACYEEVAIPDAVVASDFDRHSIKIWGKYCPYPPGTPLPIGDEGGTPQMPIIRRSEEQFRESGTYWRVSDCPHSLNLNLAHADPNQINPIIYQFLYIRPKPAN